MSSTTTLKLGESITDRLIKIHTQAISILQARKVLLDKQSNETSILAALRTFSAFYAECMEDLQTIHTQAQTQSQQL